MNGSGELGERERRAWYAFLTMQEDLRRHMNRQLLQDTGLSLADYAVLSTLWMQDDNTLRVYELRERLRWEKTRLTHQISRMVTRGQVERNPCADDPRGQQVALTPAGHEAITKAVPLHIEYVRRVFLDVVTPRQLDTLAVLSEAVLDNLGTGEDPADT
ncbi:MarR family winged helix-turn-helix transcriptional regulator [Herbidospora yilanensis]|uniref:MarR family winged helix-turn-helix transcriptional regulator n=1 Tax=Herbidospora yilanensis TaxID=354426 RepID=UPI000782B9BB|nr:MarR family winged helix-turn-helix transcriptional regulator [Herbidospora yilanensis]